MNGDIEPPEPSGGIDPAEPIFGFNRHPAAFAKPVLLPAAYPARPAAANPSAGWDPSVRFAPPGPASLSQPLLNTVVTLAPAPLQRDASLAPTLHQQILVARQSAEPDVLPAVEPITEQQVPLPETLPPDTLRAEQFDVPMPQPAAAEMWAYDDPESRPAYDDPEPPPVYEDPQPPLAYHAPAEMPAPPSIAHWVEEATDHPAVPVAALPAQNRTQTLSRAGRSAVYADPLTSDAASWDNGLGPSPSSSRWSKPVVRRSALAAIAVLVVAGAVFGAIRLGSYWLGGQVTAVFNAPMMVLRAAVTGRVMVVSANSGEVVDPKSPLFTIHTNDPGSPDRTILAGVHGLVRSVETVPGADLAQGSPLARIHDCDRAFLTIPRTAALAPGQTVQVKLPNYPAFTGTIRASAGIMEPPDSVVVGLSPNVIAGACPVGATASVIPEPKA